MASQALYRKWRSQTFDEVIGQQHITQTLVNALKLERVTHAYLFAGPRGTGKTTMARLLAKAVNCEAEDVDARPCNQCDICLAVTGGRLLDLIEIDAASNTGVDDIRDLREKVNFRPGQARRKFYIVDECFRYEDLITLADGSKLPIGKIVEKKLPIEVLSYNEQTYQIEPKPVVRHMRKQPVLPVVRITFDNNRALVCTINHKFYTPNGQMRAGELSVGQFVYANYERITQQQLEVVTGAALGDGHIAPYVSPSMDYKLLPGYRGRFVSTTDDGTLTGLAVSIVRKIERVTSPKFVYNIEVADNHNYFARDILVANCHMLSGAAFNALLKTLEEPPSHVIFVLATTEPEKIPATITSRCQRFDFKRIKLDDIVGRLSYIVDQEGLSAEPDALEYIARQASGSMRDAISLLDQLTAYGSETITIELVRIVLGAVTSQSVIALVDALLDRDVAAGLDLINQVIDDGVDPRQLAREVVEYLRAVMLAKLGDGAELLNLPDETLTAIKTQAAKAEARAVVRATTLFNEALVDIKSSLLAIPQLPLELAFVEAATPVMTVPVTTTPPQVTEAVAAPPASTAPPQTTPAPKPASPPLSPPPPPPEEEMGRVTDEPSADITVDTVRHHLGQVVKLLENKNKVMAETLRNQARLYKVSGNKIYFHTSDMLKKRFEKAQPQTAINEAFSQAIGQRVAVRFVTEQEGAQAQSGGEETVDDDAEELLKIAEELGGKVVR